MVRHIFKKKRTIKSYGSASTEDEWTIQRNGQINVREYEGAMKNGQSTETGNRVHKTKKNKTKTQHNMCWTPLCASKHK
jgi:hypothetical protein